MKYEILAYTFANVKVSCGFVSSLNEAISKAQKISDNDVKFTKVFYKKLPTVKSGKCFSIKNDKAYQFFRFKKNLELEVVEYKNRVCFLVDDYISTREFKKIMFENGFEKSPGHKSISGTREMRVAPSQV